MAYHLSGILVLSSIWSDEVLNHSHHIYKLRTNSLLTQLEWKRKIIHLISSMATCSKHQRYGPWSAVCAERKRSGGVEVGTADGQGNTRASILNYVLTKKYYENYYENNLRAIYLMFVSEHI